MYLALELSNKEWKLAFMTSDGQKRMKNVGARNLTSLKAEIERSKAKLGLPAEAQVRSCFEAGRDGFWLHRHLAQSGVVNVVVDPSSIEVDRRKRRAKTDRLDAQRLVDRLSRYWERPEEDRWRVVNVPSEEEEDARRVRREIEGLTSERTSHLARIRSLLCLCGVVEGKITEETAEVVKDWAGRNLPTNLQAEIKREYARLKLVEEQLKEVNKQQVAEIKKPTSAGSQAAHKLMKLKGLGEATGATLGHEFFGWRKFKNRKQVGACAGLCGTPYDSGGSRREQGISKAGNRRVRYTMIEAAWRWQTLQPDSAITRWFRERFGSGGNRSRRIGIVALARKLLVALWKYVEFDIMPEGAVLKKA